MNKQYQPGQTVLGNWTIMHKLGEGSFGKVFEIERNDFGQTYRAALKIITVPQNEVELRSVMEEGMDFAAAEKYFHTVVENIVREFALMARLKGTANIVSYEDHTVQKHPNGIGWDILIRMELLTPLLAHAYANPFSRRDIIRLGIDMCRALELCQKYNIIHRDIKPENIFVSTNGDFKLGDFGIARTVEKTMSGLSKKGTYNYMAPEVYRGSEYGFSVDTYSLGIVLYRMLNRNRIPFMPPAPEPITYSSRELALAKRMGGEDAPIPFHAKGRLAEIVAKAIAHNSKDRYPSPMQMREELEAILYDKEDAEAIYPDGDELALAENLYVSKTPDKVSELVDFDTSGGTQSMFGGSTKTTTPLDDATSRTQSMFGKTVHKPVASAKPKGKLKNLPIVIGVALIAVAGIFFFIYNNNQQRQIQYQEQQMQNFQSLMAQAGGMFYSNPAQAAELILQAIEIFPHQQQPQIAYAYALYLMGEFEQCIRFIEDDLAFGRDFGVEEQNRLNEILGAAYFEIGDYAASAAFFRLSTAGGEITVSAMRDYAVALGRLGSVDEAAGVLQRMFDAGADGIVTRYVQAEVDYARRQFLAAESAFLEVLNSPEADADLQRRALRSLAELYRDCAVLERLGSSPIRNAAQLQAELIADGMVRLNLAYDTVLWEMLALAYYEAYLVNPALGHEWLELSANAFHQLMALGIVRENIFSNLFAIYFEMDDYIRAEDILLHMQERYPNSYMPHALRSLMLITIESELIESERNFYPAYEEFLIAGSKITGSDDITLFQQLESLISELREQGWIFDLPGQLRDIAQGD